MAYEARLARYRSVSTSLALLSNRRLGLLLEEAQRIGSGIGGTTALLDIDGTPVFAKVVPLTDREHLPENIMSTANLFHLPPFCQYGVGSTGFGVWRELVTHVMTTNEVLGRQCECFPLLYHWRVLPGSSPMHAPLSDEQAEIERMVAFWEGALAVRERLEAIARASAQVVLFLEYIPQNLQQWLTAQVAIGGESLEQAIAIVERSLLMGVAVMRRMGLLHFDTHFHNILTDGRHLYFTDFGLATSPRFELSEAEVAFLGLHISHDECYTVTQLVNWLVMVHTDARSASVRNKYIRSYAEGADPINVPPSSAATIKHYAPIAAIMNDFYWKLHGESRTVPFPADEIQGVHL
jgi:Phosphotransferase enzyme family